MATVENVKEETMDHRSLCARMSFLEMDDYATSGNHNGFSNSHKLVSEVRSEARMARAMHQLNPYKVIDSADHLVFPLGALYRALHCSDSDQHIINYRDFAQKLDSFACDIESATDSRSAARAIAPVLKSVSTEISHDHVKYRMF